MPSKFSTVIGDQSFEELRRELAEAREQQAATAEILRVSSSSPMDLRRVFAEMATIAARLCDAFDATIRQVDGNLLRIVGHDGPIPLVDTMVLTRGVVNGRAVLERRTIHIADLQAETEEYPEGSERARRLGYRTNLAVPLIRAGEAIGVIGMRRTEARPFSNRQIELLETFAKQAVIAVENSRLLNELRETLQQQAATTEVLSVISRSPSKLQPAFDAIAAKALDLCKAKTAAVYRFDGEFIHLATPQSVNEGAKTSLRHTYPLRPSRAGAI